MEKLISCIEKNQVKEFISCLDKKLKKSFFNIDQIFSKKDSKHLVVWTHTLFSYSCYYGNLEICKYLFSKGADPIGNKSNILEGFPLAISILHNQFHIADWLQKTFNIDCSINDSWSLTISAEFGNLSAVKYALDHGADIHALDNYALKLSIWHNRFELTEWLLDHGADPNAEDMNGTILQQLVSMDQFYLAAKAVAYGADPSILSPSQQQKLNNYILSKKMTKTKKL